MKDIIRKIRSDYHRYTGKGDRPFYRIILYLLFGKNHCFNYSFWLRLALKRNWTWPFAILMHKRLSTKYSMLIHRKCKIGYGLYLGHGICMVVNPRPQSFSYRIRYLHTSGSRQRLGAALIVIT